MDRESIREDLGYLNGQEVEPMNKARFVVKKRIRFIQGQLKGKEYNLNILIADDLIAQGMAVEVVDRQPGEDG